MAAGTEHPAVVFLREGAYSGARRRIIDAAVVLGQLRGAQRLSVDELCRWAGVRQATFTRHFDAICDALLAGYEDYVNEAARRVASAIATAESRADGVGLAVAALLAVVAADEASARLWFVELPEGGPTVRRRAARLRLQALRALILAAPGAHAHPRAVDAAATLVEGINDVVAGHVAHGETADLPALVPELLHGVLLAFMGPADADIAYRRALARAAT